jgi:N-acyl-D-amino-acid deacylase
LTGRAGVLDVAIKHGMVIDGTGAPAFAADVGVQAGKIVSVGNLASAEASQELDASGLVVAPGFIDIHSHSDFTLFADPRAHSSVAQGVTTELIGNCGHGCAPVADIEIAKGNIYGYSPRPPITWHGMGEYLRALGAARPAVNVLTLVPNGMLCRTVMGLHDRRPTGDELRQIACLLEAGLDDGAIGFSVGLEYPIERACGADQLVELCTIVARRGGLFAPHLRNKDVAGLEAIEEGLEIARATGVRLHIPHLAQRPGGPEDADAKAFALIDRARRSGLDLSIDMHTRLHGLTNLAAALPPSLLDEDGGRLRARLSDPSIRAGLARYSSLIGSLALGGWDRVFLLTSARRPDLVGKSFEEMARAKGTTPFDAVLDVLVEEADDPNYPLIIAESYTEDQLRRAYEHPACMVASDATALCVDGPLVASVFHGAFTWVSWFFRRFVREEHVFTREEAVRKLTAQPAERLGLGDRGVLRVGNWADVAVFDADVFGERGTLERPNQVAQGMVHVLVNGEIEMQQGRFTSRRAGRVLTRQ